VSWVAEPVDLPVHVELRAPGAQPGESFTYRPALFGRQGIPRGRGTFGRVGTEKRLGLGAGVYCAPADSSKVWPLLLLLLLLPPTLLLQRAAETTAPGRWSGEGVRPRMASASELVAMPVAATGMQIVAPKLREDLLKGIVNALGNVGIWI